MKIVSILSSNKLSQLSLAFFVFLTIFAAITSEFFQAPLDKTKNYSELQFIFIDKNIEKMKSVVLKNKLGSFVFSKGENGLWQMTSPRNLPVHQGLMQDILLNIKNLKIQKIFQSDIINRSNFSLDNPQAEIFLNETVDYKDNSDLSIKVGLINPLNNYTYISTSLHEAIYEIKGIPTPLHSLGLLDFIESKIFLVQKDDIKNLFLYRGSNKNPSLSLKTVDGSWALSNKKPANKENVEDYLKFLINYKSQIIIDKQTAQLQDKLAQYFKRPYARLEIETKDSRKIVYEFSSPIYYLPGINITKGKSIIIRSNDFKFPVIADHKIIQQMFKNNTHFTKLEFKKLFY